MQQFDAKELAMERYEKRVGSLIAYVEKECFCENVALGIQSLMRTQVEKLKHALTTALNSELGGDLSVTELDFQEVTIESTAVFAEARKLEGMIAIVRERDSNPKWDLSAIKEQYEEV